MSDQMDFSKKVELSSEATRSGIYKEAAVSVVRDNTTSIVGNDIRLKKIKSRSRRSGFGFGTFFAWLLLFTFIGIGGGYYIAHNQRVRELVEDFGINIDGGSANFSADPDIIELQRVSITDESSAIISLAEETIESVVSIIATSSTESLFSSSTTNRSAGSGFIITDTGHIVTNKHVINDGEVDSVTVIFSNGEALEAKIIDIDPLLDIAIIKVEKTDAFTLKPLKLGTSEGVKVGQTVIAIGNSLGEFSNTVSKGIISGLNRSIIASNNNGSNPEELNDVIQTDASINSGNSGGPLIDINGNVVGVNVAKAQNGENIGFSIPIDTVKIAIESVLNTGKIVRPYIGIRYQTLDPYLAETYNLPVNYGAYLITSDGSNPVLQNTPASRAGLLSGDLIVGVNDVDIKETTLVSELQKYRPGEEVAFTIYRNGEKIKVNLKLGELPR